MFWGNITNGVCGGLSRHGRLAGLQDKRTPSLSRRVVPASEGRIHTKMLVARISARTQDASDRLSSPEVETSSSRCGESRRCTITTTPVTSGSVRTSSANSCIALAAAAWSRPRTTAHGPRFTGIVAPQSVVNDSVGQLVYHFSYMRRSP